jgi:hypothetical protein
VERERGEWVVRRDDSKVVRNARLDVALIEAIRSDGDAHWWGINPGRYARIVANSILSSSHGTLRSPSSSTADAIPDARRPSI